MRTRLPCLILLTILAIHANEGMAQPSISDAYLLCSWNCYNKHSFQAVCRSSTWSDRGSVQVNSFANECEAQCYNDIIDISQPDGGRPSQVITGSIIRGSGCDELWKDMQLVEYRRILQFGSSPPELKGGLLSQGSIFLQDRLEKPMDRNAATSAWIAQCNGCKTDEAAPPTPPRPVSEAVVVAVTPPPVETTVPPSPALVVEIAKPPMPKSTVPSPMLIPTLLPAAAAPPRIAPAPAMVPATAPVPAVAPSLQQLGVPVPPGAVSPSTWPLFDSPSSAASPLVTATGVGVMVVLGSLLALVF